MAHSDERIIALESSVTALKSTASALQKSLQSQGATLAYVKKKVNGIDDMRKMIKMMMEHQ